MSEITEITDFVDAVKAFVTAEGAYVLAGGTPPTLAGVLAGLEYTELLTFVVDQAGEGSGFQVGVAQDAINSKAALERELEMASQTKGLLYSAFVSNMQDEATFYAQSGDFYVGVIKGNTTNGSQC